ncbi:VOC family protein [Oscillospiraceae bacterium CM]|nr:VOC family protein [Oscillospiraceae bacterium CM]
MKYQCTLIAVHDMSLSKQFYAAVLGLEVAADFGANVTLTGGIALQTLDTWKGFIQKRDDEILFGSHVAELYFEEDDIDGFAAKLNRLDGIEYVHPLMEHAWGQRVIRFYDPDRHIIEVGENMTAVVRRFFDAGLSVEETAARMDVPPDFVRTCLNMS